MQIGEFAKLCGTKISVLRHYDKRNLLPPAYTDPFTGYRYYSAEQIPVFLRITALKQAGFSLSEIADLLATTDSDEEIVRLFERKEAALMDTLDNLKQAKQMMLKGVKPMEVIFLETGNGLLARSPKMDGNDFPKACELLEEAIAAGNYQRVSGYRAYGEPQSNEIEAVCDVIRLDEACTVPLNDAADLPFEDDKAVIGRWQVLGQYAVKEDFYAGRSRKGSWYGGTIKTLYFLLDGERYWCYRWTKGYLIYENGRNTTVNPYEMEEYDGERYLFIHWKSYDYRRGGKPVILVLKQLDCAAYTKEEIARCDNTDLPFVLDGQMLGKWKAHSSFRSRDEFDPAQPEEAPFWKGVEFRKDGTCVKFLGSRSFVQEWTKGFLLNKQMHLAEAYELLQADGEEYLIIEWKNGDYQYGGFLPGYYAFARVR
ncbi:MAG: helix-turn-helix domain-containing protein [Eubacteriales bacterium]